jgi:tetratricopeptide (TPR) repeat protein
MKRYVGLLFFLVLVIIPITGKTEDSSFYNQKGLNELQINNPKGAVDFFIQAISIDPSQKHYYNNLGAAYIRLGEYDKAEINLKKSLNLDAAYVKALANMSVALFHLGRYRESYSYYIQSKRIDGKYIRERFDKARVSSSIKKMSVEKPDDAELKEIRKYLDSNLLLKIGE